MALEIYLRNTLNGLIPLYSDDLEEKKRLKIGEDYKAVLTQPRNLGFHKKYFSLLKMVFDNLPEGNVISYQLPSGEVVKTKIDKVSDLLFHIKVQLGLYELKRTLGGREIFIIGSISFSSMDQLSFEKFYQETIDIILKWILIGVEKEDLLEAVLSYM